MLPSEGRQEGNCETRRNRNSVLGPEFGVVQSDKFFLQRARRAREMLERLYRSLDLNAE